MSFVGSLIAGTIRLMTPIMLAGLGEAVSQKSGVLNCGIEGYMLIGALFGYIGTYYLGNPWLGLLVGMAVTVLFALFNAYMCVSLYMDQIVMGFGTWFMATGLAGYLSYALFGGTYPRVPYFESVRIPLLADIPVIGEALFNHPLIVYIAIILIIVFYFILFKTTFGLNVRATGDNPFAADAMGVHVVRTRYLGALVSGLTAGLAGAYLSLGVLHLFSLIMIAGRGFIVLALVTFGRGHPLYVFGGSVLFSAIDWVQLRMRVLKWGIAEIWLCLPYIITILAVAFAPERGMVSRTINVPYIKIRRMKRPSREATPES